MIIIIPISIIIMYIEINYVLLFLYNFVITTIYHIYFYVHYRSPPVRCKPKADALNPCEDVMGSSWLRISVWLVLVSK